MDFRAARDLVGLGSSVSSSGGIGVLSTMGRIHRRSVTRGRDGASDVDSQDIFGQRAPEQYYRCPRRLVHFMADSGARNNDSGAQIRVHGAWTTGASGGDTWRDFIGAVRPRDGTRLPGVAGSTGALHAGVSAGRRG